jgi:hypothetical protein
MLKFVIPAVVLFLIVLFWDKINEKIYNKFKIKTNYYVMLIILIIIGVILALLYF